MHIRISNKRFIEQLLDEVEHDIMNYQNLVSVSVLIIHDIMRKPNSIIVLLIHFLNNRQKKTFSHSVSEENTPRGLVTRQTLNLT